jgi:ArsR family transcriptional regulator
LRQCGLLLDSREGSWVYYQINPTLPDWAFPILANALTAVEITGQFQADWDRLPKMASRPDVVLCG